MKSDPIAEELLDQARRAAPSHRVPYAFEKRVMSAISSPCPVDPWMQWSLDLGKLAFTSIVVAIVLMGVNATVSDEIGDSSSEDPIEVAVVAFEDSGTNVW